MTFCPEKYYRKIISEKVEISHAKQASLASIDSGISGGNKSPEESVRIPKKRAPIPPKLKAKQISDNGGVKLPGAGNELKVLGYQHLF